MEQRTAIVAGATGLVGGHLVDQLLKDDLYEKVILFSRKSLEIQHVKIQQFIVDFERLNPSELPQRADDVYCALGTTIKKAGSQAAFYKVDHDYVVNMAGYATSIGAVRFLVVSAMGANARSRIFYNRVKGEMEFAISRLLIKEKHIFRPSLILGKRSEFRFGEYLAQKFAGSLAFLFVGPLKKYRPIKAEAIAGAMIATARLIQPGVKIHPSDTMLNTKP
ncbi:MAG TPA: oxidoreductase [Bacteroidales bacterium]|jgi:uncharacterized protein YbjT (DUF2867 family)|nr:oxidoreductase [Bacteroidales bacterium]